MVIEVHEECWRARIVLFDVVCISDSLLLNEILPNLHVQHCRIVQRLLFFFQLSVVNSSMKRTLRLLILLSREVWEGVGGVRWRHGVGCWANRVLWRWWVAFDRCYFWAELLQASRLIFTQVFLKMGFKFSYIYTQYSRFNKFSDNDDLPIREYV